MRKYYRARY